MILRISIRVFGGIIEPYLAYFESLSTNLKRGMMRFSTHEYVSMLLFLSFIGFGISVITGSVLISVMVTSMTASDSFIFSYTLAIIISVIVGGSIFFAGYYYPNMRANNLKTKIDRSLPFSVFFMATTASSGIHPLEIFKTLAQKGGVIGSEANRIYNNVKTLGMNLTDSITKVANRSPSPSFADLLWGMASVITTGGSLEDYLNAKTRSFMTQYRLSLNDYAKRVALYTEIYITLVMVGSLFFIVLTAIMSPIGGMDILMLQTFVVFILTPLVSVAFIVILKGASPLD
jgi:flagellar protein FlaJ